MARNYKRLGGIINASAGPAKARAVCAEIFCLLRKNVVNLLENPVSSLEIKAYHVDVAQGDYAGDCAPAFEMRGLADVLMPRQ